MLYSKSFKCPAGNRIHVVCLNEDTLMKELLTEMRVELRDAAARDCQQAEVIATLRCKGSREMKCLDASESWSHEGGVNECDHSLKGPVVTIKCRSRGNEKEIS